MNRQGFTLTEVLAVVIIVGVLAAIALPNYARTVERSRAAEAMTDVKAVNDAIYAFFSERNTCPSSFSQLAVALPVDDLHTNTINTRYFTLSIAAEDTTRIPGTDCYGAKATRRDGGPFDYYIWNPYERSAHDRRFALRCNGTNAKSIAVCESLGMYKVPEEAD